MAAPDAEFKKRIDYVPMLLQSTETRYILGRIATEELATSDGMEVDWRAVEDRVIAEAMGEYGYSRTAVIEDLSTYSPGTLTENQKSELKLRVYDAAPELVAKYNRRFEGRRPKR